MHYYQFSIGDYRAATAHLTNEEDLAYRRLLDMYYDTEQKIPLDTQWVARRIRMEASVIREVLNDMFVRHEDGYFHARCADVIEQYHAMAEKNRANGRLGGRKKNPVGSESHPIAKATINQELITNNQKPVVEKRHTASRLPKDFAFQKEWADFCTQQRPDLDVHQTFESFKDYWIAAPKGTKLDWFATWRNWVRSQAAPKTFPNKFDVVTTTTPPPPNQDAALKRILEDDKKAVPPSLETLEKLASLRRKAA
jgi:uncharacterized protein YdaU (DUF1376 family)